MRNVNQPATASVVAPRSAGLRACRIAGFQPAARKSSVPVFNQSSADPEVGDTAGWKPALRLSRVSAKLLVLSSVLGLAIAAQSEQFDRGGSDAREASGVRGFPALSTPVEYTALQTLRDPEGATQNSGRRIRPGLRARSTSAAPVATAPPSAKLIPLPDGRSLRLVSIGQDPVYHDLLGLRTNGWLGSDVGESIVLSKEKSLWLFGDTFIGPLSKGVRVAGAPMINSTIAIQDRTKPPPNCLKFYWKHKDGKPASFFPHQANTPGDYYWVTKGVVLDGELFLYAFCISGGNAEGLFNWKEAGSALIRVPNPLDPPEQWVQKAYPLNLPTNDSFHAALLVQPPYLYLYGIVQPRQTAVARVSIDDLVQGKLTEAYEYWVNGPTGPHWSKEPTNCVPQFLPVNSECSVHYEPAWKLYTCFTYDVLNSPNIFLTTAPAPTGPWSKPEPIYTIPEYHRYSFSIMAYALRQHPELSTRRGEVILSYATNVPDSEKQLFTPEGKDVYVHRFVRAEFELDDSR